MTRKRRGRGEGSIFQRSDGTWCASVSAGYGTDGRRRRKTVYGATKGEVQDKLRTASLEIANGKPIDTGKLTVQQYLGHWLTTIKTTVAPGTYERYSGIVDNQLVPHLGSMSLAKLQPVHVQQLYAALDKAESSARTQQLAGVTLGCALKAAVVAKLIVSNPVRDIPKPRTNKRTMSIWSKAEANEFLKAAKDDRLYAMYVLELATGLRQGELFALQWGDIDFGEQCLTVQRSLEEINGKLRLKEPKAGRGRRIDLPDFAIKAMSQHRAAMLAEGNIAGPVFCDTDGGLLRKGNVYRRSFVPIRTAAKVPEIRFHDMRHTHATLLLMAGENVKVVSERLGHAKIQVTLDTYAHVLPSMQRAAADKMQALFG